MSHHIPNWCYHCQCALEPFKGKDPDFPLDAFICPKCRTVICCACDSCMVLVALVYNMPDI